MSVANISTDNFDNEVLKSNKITIVDFAASWCGPCQMMKPVFHELAEEKGEYKFCSIDIDESPITANNYNVKFVPTFIAFKNGDEIGRCVGVVSKEEILNMIKS